MSSICKGVTKKNLPCLKKTKNKNGFCSIHDKEKKCLSECCICYENNVGDTLSCNHSICTGCIGQLRKFSCPMCREKLSGKILTVELIKKIEQNEHEDKMERVNNNLLAAMEHQRQINEMEYPEQIFQNVYVRNNDDIMMYVDNRWLLITRETVIIV